MSTENTHKTLHALIESLNRLITILVRQSLIIQNANRKNPDKKGTANPETPGLVADKNLLFPGKPEFKTRTPREFDRIFLKSLRIRFEDFSEV